MRKASRASEGTVWRMATTPSSTPAAPGQRQAAMPIGTPTATATTSEPNTSSRCSAASRPRSGANRRAQRSGFAPLVFWAPLAACAPLARVPPTATPRVARKRAAVSAKLRPSSSTSPFIAIMVAASMAPVRRCNGRDVDALAHQQHRVVLGEEGAIVLEHPQAEAAQLRIGRVDVDHVDLARRHRVVREPVVEAGRRRRQRVGLAQRRPAVGTLQELVRKAELQRPPLCRSEVGNA